MIFFSCQGVFEDPGDKEVVSFYTSCSGTNVFSSALSTAFIQATAAKELVASVDDDIFAASCLNEVKRQIWPNEECVRGGRLGSARETKSVPPVFLAWFWECLDLKF